MDSHSDQLCRYECWANEQLVRSLDTLPTGPDAKTLRVLSHLAAAMEVWLDRLEGRSPTTPLWPDWDVTEANRRLATAGQRLLQTTQTQTAEPDRPVEYRNSSGTPFTTPAAIVLMHLVNHGTYHRGQLATAIKDAGGQPAVTDLIVWHRAGSP